MQNTGKIKTMTKNIVLTGLMGSGKTTLGKYLAEITGMEFLDTDDLIVKKAGKPITEIFAEDGEPHFRDLESQVIAEAAQKTGCVISTGGGAVKRQKNIDNLKSTGMVFYLQASAEELYERTKHDSSRPLLNVDDPVAVLKKLLAERAPLYETAHFTVNTEKKSIEEVSKQILELCQSQSRSPA